METNGQTDKNARSTTLPADPVDNYFRHFWLGTVFAIVRLVVYEQRVAEKAMGGFPQSSKNR